MLRTKYVGGVGSDVLCRLARSKNMWERRTAIYATMAFVRRGERDDTFAIAEMLLGDKEDLIHKAAGGMLRATGNDRPRLAGLPRQARCVPCPAPCCATLSNISIRSSGRIIWGCGRLG